MSGGVDTLARSRGPGDGNGSGIGHGKRAYKEEDLEMEIFQNPALRASSSWK